jgi:hypothetical protein
MTNIKKLSTKELYFVVTTGRSGTAFLAKYISQLGHPCSLHEPTPQFHTVMRKALYQPEVARDFWETKKAPAILNTRGHSYVETSHLVCKGFLEPLFKENIFPNLILLKRNNRDVAKSLYYLNTIPGRTKAGLEYYLKPDDPGILLPLSDWSNLTDYQLCYWYTLEIEQRQRFYADFVQANGARVLQVDFNYLMSGKLYEELVHFLGIPKKNLLKRLELVLSTFIKVNAKRRNKLKKTLTTVVDFEAEEIDLRSKLYTITLGTNN